MQRLNDRLEDEPRLGREEAQTLLDSVLVPVSRTSSDVELDPALKAQVSQDGALSSLERVAAAAFRTVVVDGLLDPSAEPALAPGLRGLELVLAAIAKQARISRSRAIESESLERQLAELVSCAPVRRTGERAFDLFRRPALSEPAIATLEPSFREWAEHLGGVLESVEQCTFEEFAQSLTPDHSWTEGQIRNRRVAFFVVLDGQATQRIEPAQRRDLALCWRDCSLAKDSDLAWTRDLAPMESKNAGGPRATVLVVTLSLRDTPGQLHWIFPAFPLLPLWRRPAAPVNRQSPGVLLEVWIAVRADDQTLSFSATLDGNHHFGAVPFEFEGARAAVLLPAPAPPPGPFRWGHTYVDFERAAHLKGGERCVLNERIEDPDLWFGTEGPPRPGFLLWNEGDKWEFEVDRIQE